MKILNRLSLTTLVFSCAIGLVGPLSALAATAPSLGSEDTYGVVSTTFTNSNTAPQTIINGSVCGTTLNVPLPLTITGGAPETPCAPLKGTDQSGALAILNGQVCTPISGSLNAVIIGANPPGTFPPGCYEITGAMDITLSTTVTLDATAPGGDGGNVFIFRSSGALNTGNDSIVALANGASASNVFWAPVGLATIGAYTTGGIPPVGPTFVGSILDAAGVTVGHFANILGRALAFGATVTTDANTITSPTAPSVAVLHVIKLVVNGNGGTAVATDFNVHVKSGGVDVAGSPALGTSTPGTPYTLSAGTYVVSEDAHAGYVTSFTTDCDAAGSVTLAGVDKICTIVNTDIPPPPLIVSGGGGRIIPLIGILKVPNPLALPAGSGLVTYGYTVWNVGGQQALVDVTVTDDKCGPVTLLSGDTNGNGKLDISESWKYSCAATLATTTTNTAVATGFSDDSFHQAAIATSISTVIVGFVPGLPNTGLLAPLINIIKVPSRLTPFPFGGGMVTYTYTVTNPGVTPISNVTVTDDKCGPVSGAFGDTNQNALLDAGEAWTYTCQTNVTVSTRNTATARGISNGFTAIGYAFATVLVTAPGLPNTGLPPFGTTLLNLVAFAGLFVLAIALARLNKIRA